VHQQQLNKQRKGEDASVSFCMHLCVRVCLCVFDTPLHTASLLYHTIRCRSLSK
jgi:hypothetical protein